MTSAHQPEATTAMRPWPLLAAPRATVAYTTFVDFCAVLWCAVAIFAMPSANRAWGLLSLLVVLSLLFEEGARRAARLKLRLNIDMKRDMTSVWCVAAAVALPPRQAVVLLTILMSYVWFRQQRPAGEILYRKVFNAGTAILGCLSAGLAARHVHDLVGGAPWMLAGLFTVIVAIIVHASVNRILVTFGVMTIGIRGRALLGGRDDNMIELATLCLGGLVAVAVTYQPWAAVLVLGPMIALQRSSLVHELETAAMTDSKTGMLNAVAWEQLAQREIVRAKREDHSIAVLLIDIDRFKRVNDRYGHLIGDQVLREIGQNLGSSLREYDTVGRFGGEEFVAILPNATEDVALSIAERVRGGVNQLVMGQFVPGADGDDDTMSISIGVAVLPRDGMELTDLLRAADVALYLAKASGRNRVQLAHRDGGMGERLTV